VSRRFALPLVLDGESIRALVVGAGGVGARKARSLLEGGAAVRVVAMHVSAEVTALAESFDRLTLEIGRYTDASIRDEAVVVAATDDPGLNAQIARDALARGRLVNVADDPELGNCVTPAVHRAGELVIAVAAGGVPTAAARVRDEIARNIDGRYGAAVAELARLRTRLLRDGARGRWREVVDSVVGMDFCEIVRRGEFEQRIAEWR
jgi:siroheme synthase-like protein